MTTKFNSINNKPRFFIQSLYQDRRRQSRIVHTKKSSSKDLSSSTAIHSYPSAKVQDLSNFVKQYNGYHKIENPIIHVGQNKIDSGNGGFETASILMESASEMIKKLSPLKVAHCKIPPVKDVFLVAAKITKTDEYNEALENVATELSGVSDNDVVFLNNMLETKDISNDKVPPSVSHGIPKLVRNVRNFYVELLTETLEKILLTIITTIFLVSIQNKHFYLQLIINLADGLLKYRTMRLFLIFLIFSIFMGRENRTEIHRRTFEKKYSNKLMFVIF